MNMCLAIPGEVLSLDEEDPMSRRGKVSFGGVVREASLAYVPEAQVGDYVIVHAGFAISKLDKEEAEQVFETLRQMEALSPEKETRK
jgi:hydrogenase expression/formation protein HypC